uniref:Uncharacterized protein n=1 Tax=Brassica oleracea TaxID=3712 RepID=A0A3P6BBB2_BRAOL|nr:unnamed protein product [Brassica oleracea]
MSSSTDPSSALSEPPWPPDLCLISPDSRFSQASNLAYAMFLHPEVSPSSPSPPSRPSSPVIPPAASSEAPTANLGPSTWPSSALWVSKLKSWALVKLCN